MKYLIQAPERIDCTIYPPASKSISNRALIINTLSYSPLPIKNLAKCDDTEVLAKALNSNKRNFDVGAAGTAMRFLTAYLSKIVGEWTITGTERMQQRPIKLLVDVLRQLGARIEYTGKEGYPPLKIYGSALQGGEITMDGGVSSQYISALLMIAPCMENGLTLNLTGQVISRPYIQLTLRLMEQFGISSFWKDQTIRIAPQEYRPTSVFVESDWSATSYWYEMMALQPAASIAMTGLRKNSMQGDAAVAKLFERLGVHTAFDNEGVRLRSGVNTTKKLVYNFVNEPDLAQTLVVTALFLDLPFRFSGLQSLKIKETDRVGALQTELRKLGYVINESADGVLEWNGERCEPEADPVINTYEDHRMAMAFAPVALKRLEGICIADPEVVSKSYPRYWDDLRKAGFTINEISE